jgi:hypothetical protein
MKPEGSLPCSQQPATGPCPDPVESSPQSSNLFPNIHSNIIFPSTYWSSEWLFPSCFQMNILYTLLISPIPVICPAHFILPDLITLIIFSEAYKLWGFSLCSLLQPPATSSLLVQNILSTLFSTFSIYVLPLKWQIFTSIQHKG